MCHVPACLRGLRQTTLPLRVLHPDTRPHMPVHIGRRAAGESTADCLLFCQNVQEHIRRTSSGRLASAASQLTYVSGQIIIIF